MVGWYDKKYGTRVTGAAVTEPAGHAHTHILSTSRVHNINTHHFPHHAHHPHILHLLY